MPPSTPPLNVFAGLSRVLDRAAERRDQAEWLALQAASPAARYLPLAPNGEAWLSAVADSLQWLDTVTRHAAYPSAPISLLGLFEARPHFLLALQDDDVPPSPRRLGLREAGLLLPAAEAGLFAYAKGLAYWQRETRFCSGCGAPLRLVAAGHRAQCNDPACARLHFPRTDAAIIVLVEHQDACLLGRQASWPAGRYSALAGFLEPGEALEDAVRREVAEEAGVCVDQVRYHSSQPWPLPASLMGSYSPLPPPTFSHLNSMGYAAIRHESEVVKADISLKNRSSDNQVRGRSRYNPMILKD